MQAAACVVSVWHVSHSCARPPPVCAFIQGLCTAHGIPLIMVSSADELGEWCGLCKIDAEGQARKIVSCSCACITDYGEDTEALSVLREYIKAPKSA